MSIEEYISPVLAMFLVVFITQNRFNKMPRIPAPIPEKLPLWWGTLRSWFQVKYLSSEPLFPPPRANTTVFKFWTFSILYSMFGLMLYVLLYNFPILRTEIQNIIDLTSGTGKIMVENASPIVLAVILVFILPNIPPFRGADATIRRFLYARASIPAQQQREMSRLKQATYNPREESLQEVRQELVLEGFDVADIRFQKGIPTVHSMWTKASLLIQHIQHWQTLDQYKTTFQVLREPDGHSITVTKVLEHYHALKGDARTCFDLLRQEANKPETEDCRLAFRQHCKELLKEMYHFISRISLHAHYSEHERIKKLGDIGFELKMDKGGPVPDANEVFSILIILFLVNAVPLGQLIGFSRSLPISMKILVCLLIPILLARRFPKLCEETKRGIPRVTFIVVSGLVAALTGFLISLIFLSGGDFFLYLESYTTHYYPWTFLHASIAMLIAWRINKGTYPETQNLEGWKRYQAWGNMKEAAIFLGCVVALMVLVVLPLLRDLNPAFEQSWVAAGLSGIVAFVLGFLVPTWYRANSMRQKGDWKEAFQT